MRFREFPSAVAGIPLRSHGGLLRFARTALFITGAVFALLAVIVGVAIAVVLSGPTEVGFVRDRFEAALRARIGDAYAVKVGRAVVDVDPVLGLVIEVDGVEVRDRDGAAVALVPATRFAVDPLALLAFRLSVSTVELSGADLSLVRAPGGAVFLGTSGTVQPAEAERGDIPNVMANEPGFPDLFAALRILDQGLDEPLRAAAEAGILKLGVVGGRIGIWDAAAEEQRTFPNVDLAIAIDPANTSLSASLAASGYGGRWSAHFERTVAPDTGERSFSAVFSQLSLADIFPDLGQRTSVVSADMPLYGRANVTFAADGTLAAATARLDIGAGFLRFGEDRDEVVLLDEATLRLRWDTEAQAVVIEPSPFHFGETQAVLTGNVRPGGGSGRYGFDIETRGAILAAEGAGPPLVADRIAVAGVADLPARLIEVSNFSIMTPAGAIAAAGSVGFDGEAPSVAVAASFSTMPIAALKQMWPPFLASGARRWFMENVRSGTIRAGRFEAAIPAGILWGRDHPPMPEDALRLDVRFEDATFATFGGLPPVRAAAGNAVLAGSTFGVDLDAGEVPLRSGARVKITAGAFAVDDVFLRHPDGLIELELAGTAEALGELANADPLRVLERREMAPGDLAGDATASVSLRLPLRDNVTAAEVDWRVTVKGTNLGSRAPIDGRRFSKAAVTIAVTPEAVTVDGRAEIDGVPADVAMTQPLTSDGLSAGAGEQRARFTLDQAARKRLGIGLDDILGGTVGALVSGTEDGVGQHFDLDLRQARLTIPGLGWSKGVGVPARLTFDMRPAAGGYRVADVVLDGNGFGFRGTAQLDGDHGLVSADIEDFALRPGDAAAFRLERTKTGYRIEARGTAFDVRGVIAGLTGGDGSGGVPDILLDARLDRLTGHNDETVADARLSLALIAGIPQKVSFSGTIGGAPASVAYTEAAGGATLRASADDAGRVLRFLDLYTRMRGGGLSIVADRRGRSGPLSGAAEIVAFDVADDPALARAVSTASGRDGSPPPAHADGGRAHFDRLVAQFRKTDDAIAIDDALIRGSLIGATFSGRVDLVRDTVAINGTYIPAYAFNNAFGRLPLIGLVLGGGSRGGLIGVTFRVEGPTSQPRAYFNPLSAVTPGIFRKIFEFR